MFILIFVKTVIPVGFGEEAEVDAHVWLTIFTWWGKVIFWFGPAWALAVVKDFEYSLCPGTLSPIHPWGSTWMSPSLCCFIFSLLFLPPSFHKNSWPPLLPSSYRLCTPSSHCLYWWYLVVLSCPPRLRASGSPPPTVKELHRLTQCSGFSRLRKGSWHEQKQNKVLLGVMLWWGGLTLSILLPISVTCLLGQSLGGLDLSLAFSPSVLPGNPFSQHWPFPGRLSTCLSLRLEILRTQYGWVVLLHNDLCPLHVPGHQMGGGLV